MRIHILGGPGSGKTTLAQIISDRFQIPHHDMDKIFWKNGNSTIAFIEDAIVIAEQPTWVSENIGLIWVDPLLYRADYIVLLEVSWLVAAWRIIRRHVSKSLRGINPYPTKLLLPFLKDTRRYYLSKAGSGTPIAEAMHAYLKEHEADTDLASLETLCRRLENCKDSVPLSAEFTRLYLEKYREKVILVKDLDDREHLLELLSKK